MEMEKESFQEKLQRMVWSKLLLLVGTGMVLFAAGMFLTIAITNQKNAEENRKLFESIFREVYEKSREFLTGEALETLAESCLLYDSDPVRLQYLLYEFNAACPMEANLILIDKERNIIYNSFQAGDWNQYRNSFNKAICDNAFGISEGQLYSSVYYLSGPYSDYVLSRPVYIDGKTMGYVTLYLPGSGWAKLLSVSNFEGVITDRAGRVIYSSRQSFIEDINKFSPEKQRGILYLGGERYRIWGGELPEGEVFIYSLIYCPQNGALLFLGCCIILALGVCWFGMALDMSRAMAASNAATVKRLVAEMDVIVNGNPDHRISMDTNDEFADVGLKINYMLDSIQELNRHNTELLQLKRAAEINQLTAQINPHFLYNTLENLRNSLVFDPAMADRMILKLTRILRYSIDEQKEEVLLREDMDYLDSYLDIQKCRYGDRLVYELSLEDSCYECRVPKLICQPIVENSIKHGFKNKMELHIWVDGYVQEGVLHLSITDDGMGMAKEEIEELNRSLLNKDGPAAHKGLRNIARRLFLQYGEKSGIRIRNLEGGGLQVIVNVAQNSMEQGGR